jgi:hypothetical protein
MLPSHAAIGRNFYYGRSHENKALSRRESSQIPSIDRSGSKRDIYPHEQAFRQPGDGLRSLRRARRDGLPRHDPGGRPPASRIYFADEPVAQMVSNAHAQVAAFITAIL